jgi:ubiquinol-cytochrome c reductase cytochrome b subunit
VVLHAVLRDARAVPSYFDSQFWGVLVMGIAVLIFFFLPWLDRGAVKSIRYRGRLYKSWLAAFVISFLILGYLGVVPVTVWGQFADNVPILGGADRATVVARVSHRRVLLFFFLMPWYTLRDKTKPSPDRVRHDEADRAFLCDAVSSGVRRAGQSSPAICAS